MNWGKDSLGGDIIIEELSMSTKDNVTKIYELVIFISGKIKMYGYD